MNNRPNIVLIVPDSYRGDVLGHLGNPGAVTPHLDALVARDAVSYRNAFAQNPVCSPSRCSFMTGWYPHVHGHRSMRNLLKEHEPHLLKVLRQAGYQVWWGGKNDLVRVHRPEDYLQHCDLKFSPKPPDPDAPRVRPPPALAPDDPRHGAYHGGVIALDPQGQPYGSCDDGWIRAAADLIRRPPTDAPFCCYLPLHTPHPAYRVREDFYRAIDPARLPPRIPAPGRDARLPPVLDDLRAAYRADEISEEAWLDIRRIYYAMCAEVDLQVGRIVDALRQSGRYDNTWILFFSDHGDFTGDYSLPEKTHSTLQDCLLRVPLVIKPPAAVPTRPGLREHLTELIDLPATLYDLLGLQPGYTHFGRSLRDSLAGSEAEIHEAVFAEVGGRANEPGFFNKEVDALPPDHFYARQGRSARAHHQAGSHAVMCRTRTHKYIRRPYTGHHEIFDLTADPHEVHNLHGTPAAAAIEPHLAERLLDFFLRTADVLPHETDSRHI